MKKQLIVPLILSLLIPLGALGATNLYEYYQEKGEPFLSVTGRLPIAESCGIEGYRGTAEQNQELLNCLKGDQHFGIAIPSVVALFETSLQAKISSAATSMTLVSGTTKDGTTLSGTYGFVIDEGTASEEFVLAACIDTACTSMTRGISVLDGKTEVTALKKEHRRGASVKITNYPQLSILSRILNGDEGAPNVMFYATNLNIGAASTSAFATKAYVDGVGAGGFTAGNVATGYGIRVFSTAPETIGLSTSTASGLHINSGVLSVNLSSEGGLLIDSNGGVAISTTTPLTWSGAQTFTATTSIAASSVTNNALTINGLNYQFPSTSTASSTLTTNGAGTLYWSQKSRLLYKTITDVVIANTVATTTILTATIPANSLGLTNIVKFRLNFFNTGYRLYTAGSYPVWSYVKITFGAESDIYPIYSSSDLGLMYGYFEGTIQNTTATNAQELTFQAIGGGTAGVGSVNLHKSGYATAAIDTTSNQTLTVQFSFGLASEFCYITIDSAYIELLTE